MPQSRGLPVRHARGVAPPPVRPPVPSLREPVVPPHGGYIGLLADETARMSLELLAERGPLSHAAHMRRVCELRYVSASTFERVHRQLVQAGLVVCLPCEGDRRRRVDGLALLAPALLRIAREVEAVERWASPALRALGAPPLLGTIADHRGWMVMRELFDGPFPYTELSARVPWLAQGTFNELLGSLTRAGLVRVEPGRRPGQHCYGLSELVGALARVTLLAARFRRQIAPRDAPWLTGDLPSFIRLLERVPSLRGPHEARGTVLLQVITPPSEERGWPEVEVALRHGRIMAHRLGAAAPSASARASPLAWCDAALRGSPSRIEIQGDVELGQTLLRTIAAAVDGCPRP